MHHFIVSGASIAVCALLASPVLAADLSLRLLPSLYQANAASPFANGDQAVLRAETLLNWQQAGWSFAGALSAERDNWDNETVDAHLNELFYDTSLGDWELSIGKKRLGWGLGFGFRPLDTIQNEPRRPVQPVLLDGVPALILEKFTPSNSLSLIYAAKNEWHDWRIEDTQHSATLRLYQFTGDWEFMGLSAWEQDSGLTVGGGLSLSQGDNWKFHGELAWKQQYPQWRSHLLDSGELFYPGNPLYQVQQDGAWQGVLGAQWTHSNGIGVLLEYWYDGTAWNDSDWYDLLTFTQQQQAALSWPQSPIDLLQANIAAAEQAYLHPNLLRHNLLLRLSHDSGERTFALEYLLAPENGSGALTLLLEDSSLDQQKLRFGVRLYSGVNHSAYGALADAWIIFATWEMGWKL